MWLHSVCVLLHHCASIRRRAPFGGGKAHKLCLNESESGAAKWKSVVCWGKRKGEQASEAVKVEGSFGDFERESESTSEGG